MPKSWVFFLRQGSSVKYLIAPGLVHHNKKYGLKFGEIEKYWEKRFSLEGERTIGLIGHAQEMQDELYQKRYSFILPHIPRDLYIMDYGCGVGRYSHFFDKTKYVGVDISIDLLGIAERNNPGYLYYKLKKPIPESINFKPQMFFTATVLQHNCNTVVVEIFKELSKLVDDKILLCLYENTSINKGDYHIAFRKVEEYMKLISNVFKIEESTHDKHVIHKEEHSLMIIKCSTKEGNYENSN